MQNIQQLATFRFNTPPAQPAGGKTASALLKQPGQQILEIILANNETLAKHTANVPITVLCLAGEGTFYAGVQLEEALPLSPGVLLALPAHIPHEVRASSTLQFLVSKFG